jgi:hypothetical protein
MRERERESETERETACPGILKLKDKIIHDSS